MYLQVNVYLQEIADEFCFLSFQVPLGKIRVKDKMGLHPTALCECGLSEQTP
jgi:hypothetical protein